MDISDKSSCLTSEESITGCYRKEARETVWEQLETRENHIVIPVYSADLKQAPPKQVAK